MVKVVNETNDANNLDWINVSESIQDIRFGMKRRLAEFRSRQVVNDEGWMELYFLNNDPARIPNRKALEFHKTACLIWRMAGGAESDEEFCPDDHDTSCVPSDINSKSIHKWIEDSNTTLNIFID